MSEEETFPEMHAEARRRAQATVYALTNPFTSDAEKLEIESWYQLPFYLAGYTFLAGSVGYAAGRIGGGQLFLMASAANLAAALVCWVAYSPRWAVPLWLIAANQWLRWTLHLGVAGWFVARERYGLAAIVAVSLLTAHIPLSIPSIAFNQFVTARYRMHPKYAFLKHFYGKRYSFDER